MLLEESHIQRSRKSSWGFKVIAKILNYKKNKKKKKLDGEKIKAQEMSQNQFQKWKLEEENKKWEDKYKQPCIQFSIKGDK